MKKYLSMLIIVVLLFSLTACGNNNSYTYESVSNNTNTDTGDEIGTVDPVPASEAFNTKSIWFGISDSRNFAKDSYIQVVFAFDGNGNVTVYNNVGLFEFSMINNNMSDEEILAIVKDIEMEARAKKGISEEPQPQPINLQVLTDDSGNITEEELLKYTDDESGLGGAVINRELVVDPFIQQIYDMQFMGYSSLKTRIMDSGHPGFNLDSADTAGITVD